MNTREAYNKWAAIYDTNRNRTRDLEAVALKETLQGINISDCLEIGCGTGKNTSWLAAQANQVTAVDFSDEMLAKAIEKNKSQNVRFQKADVSLPWPFTPNQFDLVTFSLVLEHFNNLDFMFSQAARMISADGYCYLGELHPYKQYLGTKARFTTGTDTHTLSCFTHNISDFIASAKKNGFEIADLKEFSHHEDTNLVPRILTILFRKAG